LHQPHPIPHPIRIGFQKISGHLQGEARLARAARAGERQQPRRGQPSFDLLDLSLAAYEAASRRGQVVRRPTPGLVVCCVRTQGIPHPCRPATRPNRCRQPRVLRALGEAPYSRSDRARTWHHCSNHTLAHGCVTAKSVPSAAYARRLTPWNCSGQGQSKQNGRVESECYSMLGTGAVPNFLERRQPEVRGTNFLRGWATGSYVDLLLVVSELVGNPVGPLELA
jgi:hypothetical protein